MAKLTTQEKMMLAIIVMLITGIILSWKYISKEAGDSVKAIFNKERTISE